MQAFTLASLEDAARAGVVSRDASNPVETTQIATTAAAIRHIIMVSLLVASVLDECKTRLRDGACQAYHAHVEPRPQQVGVAGHVRHGPLPHPLAPVPSSVCDAAFTLLADVKLSLAETVKRGRAVSDFPADSPDCKLHTL
jgi:hypothetical protein